MDIDDKEQPSYSELEQRGQGSLLDVAPDWAKHWQGMPEFNHKNLQPKESIIVHFRNREDRLKFEKLIGQRVINGQGSLWFPKVEIERYADKKYISANPLSPTYPVYIVSKGRWESRFTAKSLEKIDVDYKIVIEPQEYDQYSAVIDKKKILTLPFSNLGQGSIPARNWIWEHAIQSGSERHWILDDNLAGFYRFQDNLKCPVGDGTIFRIVEDFANRYENVAIAGLNYFMFVTRKSGSIKPFTINTRIYSCLLIDNRISHRWRGRYNEDTDLSIRVLKDGLCTVLFNALLCNKPTTMRMKGGNTDELYQGDGRLKMAQSLQEQHPDVVTITEKWGRYQHQVNYAPFKKNKLILKKGINESTDYGLELVKLNESDVAPVPQESDQNGAARHDSPSNGQAEENKRIREGIDMQALKKSWAAIQHKVDEEHVQEHLQQMFRF